MGSIYYIILKIGKNVETALDEMLYGENVNKDSSVVKTAIDYWYYLQVKSIMLLNLMENHLWINVIFGHHQFSILIELELL